MFMHRKAVFALAGVFLAIAAIVPPVIFILQADNDLDNLIIIRNNPGMETAATSPLLMELVKATQPTLSLQLQSKQFL